jgi:hypothetical protein
VNKVQFNGAEIPNVQFIVGVNELGAGIMGVLGRNFLSIADTEYDLAHGVVRLVFPKGDCKKPTLPTGPATRPSTCAARHDTR